MSPTLVPGDEVRLELARAADITAGDVVVVRRGGGSLAIHRVVSVGPDAIVTRGDACPHDDPPVRADRVLLRAAAMRRGGRERGIPRRPPAATRRLRSILGRFRGSARAALGRWWPARPSSSTSTGGASWA